jgi:hypothetical protein
VTDRPEARSAAPEGLSPGARPTRTSAPDDELAQWRASWQDELDSAHVYRAIAAGARDDATRELFGRLAQVEEKHSEVGARRLAELGAPVPATGRPTRRARILAALGRRFGARFVLGALAGGEASAGARYRSLGELGVALATDEAAHARSLAALARGRPQAHGERHRLGAGNTLRAGARRQRRAALQLQPDHGRRRRGPVAGERSGKGHAVSGAAGGGVAPRSA